jgi:hypothetical protein
MENGMFKKKMDIKSYLPPYLLTALLYRTIQISTAKCKGKRYDARGKEKLQILKTINKINDILVAF